MNWILIFLQSVTVEKISTENKKKKIISSITGTILCQSDLVSPVTVTLLMLYIMLQCV
jgi:hypothetical protein